MTTAPAASPPSPPTATRTTGTACPTRTGPPSSTPPPHASGLRASGRRPRKLTASAFDWETELAPYRQRPPARGETLTPEHLERLAEELREMDEERQRLRRRGSSAGAGHWSPGDEGGDEPGEGCDGSQGDWRSESNWDGEQEDEPGNADSERPNEGEGYSPARNEEVKGNPCPDPRVGTEAGEPEGRAGRAPGDGRRVRRVDRRRRGHDRTAPGRAAGGLHVEVAARPSRPKKGTAGGQAGDARAPVARSATPGPDQTPARPGVSWLTTRSTTGCGWPPSRSGTAARRGAGTGRPDCMGELCPRWSLAVDRRQPLPPGPGRTRSARTGSASTSRAGGCGAASPGTATGGWPGRGRRWPTRPCSRSTS